jgi:DNA-binding MarR family transcriptional regulator
MNHMSEPGHVAAPPSFTAKQGQYLAFIHAYTLVLGRSPAEADLQRYFRVTPPSVHGMVLSLERSGLIRREQGARAASVCWSTQWRCHHYSRATFKQSKPL